MNKEIKLKIKGIKGDSPTDEQLVELIKPLIPEPLKGDVGPAPSDEKLVELITPLIPEPKNGETPTDDRLIGLIKPLIILPEVKEQIEETPNTLVTKVNKSDLKIEKDRLDVDWEEYKNKETTVEDVKGLPETIRQIQYSHARQVGGGGVNVALKTNNVSNTIQTELNLKQGTNVTLVPDALGGVTINAAGGDLSGFVPYTGATTTVDLGTNTISSKTFIAENSTTVTLSAPTGLSASMTNLGSGSFGDDTQDLTYYVSFYAYKVVGLTTLYSLQSTEINIGNNVYQTFDIVFSFTPVSGATGYKFVLRDSNGNYSYLTGTSTSSISGYVNANSTITPTAPQDFPAVVADLNGSVPTDNIDFQGKMRLYDANGAVVIGDITGNSRGANAIDISTSRSASDNVASGVDALLIGKGKATGNDSIAIGNSTASGSLSVSIGNGTASNTQSTAINGQATASGATAIGGGVASADSATAIGSQSSASGAGSFALGFFSQSTGSYTVTLGRGVQSSGDYSQNFGYNFTDNTPNAINLGMGLSASVGGNITLLRLRDTEGAELFRTLNMIASTTLGAEILKNGTFSSATSWTLSSTWAITSGTLRATTVVNDANIAKQLSTTLNEPINAGETYELTYTISSRTAGGVRAHIGGAYTTVQTTNGTYTQRVVATTSGLDFWFERQSGVSTTLRIDNATLKKIPAIKLNLISPNVNYQTEIGYDSSNKYQVLVSSTGVTTFDAIGSNPSFVFSDPLEVNGTTRLGTSGTVFTKIVSGTATLNFPNISSNSTEELTMTVTGAIVGNSVHIGAPSTIETGLGWSGYVSATNTVTIRVHNSSGGAVDPASATWRATVMDF
jgi:hypothetical protein